MAADGYFHVPRRLLLAKIPQERKYALVWFAGQASYAPREVDGVTLAVGETPPVSLTRLEDEFRMSRKAVRLFLDYALSDKCAEETGMRLSTGQKCTGHSQGHREGHSQGHTYHVAIRRVKGGEGHSQGHREGHSQGHTIKEEGFKEGKKKRSTGLPAQERRTSLDYSPVFLQAFSVMPYRGGHNNPKAAAWRAWCARRKEGVEEKDMLEASKRYGEFCDATNLSGTQHAMQAATFFGPGRPFEQEWEIPVFNGNGRHG